MDFANDPVGTRYGCIYSYTKGAYGTFSELTREEKEGKSIGDPIYVYGYQFKPYDENTKPMWKYGLEITPRFSYTYETDTEVFANGVSNKTKEPIDFNDYKEVYDLDMNKFTIKALPKDTLHVTRNPIKFNKKYKGLFRSWVKWTGQLICYMALSVDGNTWYTYNPATTKIEEVDLTQDTDTLKTKLYNASSMEDIYGVKFKDTPFEDCTQVYLAILTCISVPAASFNVKFEHRVTDIIVDMIDNPAITTIKQEFNWIKVGHRFNGDVILVADRVLQTYLRPYDIIGNINAHEGDHGWRTRNNVPMKNGNFLRLIQSNRYEYDEPSEYDHFILNAGENILRGKTVEEVFHTEVGTITGRVFNYNISNVHSFIVRGGETGKPGKFSTIDRDMYGIECGFRPVLIVDTTSPLATRKRSHPALPVVENLRDLVRGKCIGCDVFYKDKTGNTRKTIVFKNLGHPVMAPMYNYGEVGDGAIYFICAGYTTKGDRILVADRVILGDYVTWYDIMYYVPVMSYDDYRSANTIDGYPTEIDGMKCKLRFLTTTNDLTNIVDGEYASIINNSYDKTKSTKEIWNTGMANELTSNVYVKNGARYIITRSERGAQGIVYHNEALPVLNNFYENKYTGVGFRPVILIPAIRLVRCEVTPYVVYSKSDITNKFNVEIEIRYGDNDILMKYKLKIDNKVISEYSDAPTRTISYEVLERPGGGNRKIDIVVINPDTGLEEIIYSVYAYEEPAARNSVNRWAFRHTGGWDLKYTDKDYKDNLMLMPPTIDMNVTTKGTNSYIEIDKNLTGGVRFY